MIALSENHTLTFLTQQAHAGLSSVTSSVLLSHTDGSGWQDIKGNQNHTSAVIHIMVDGLMKSRTGTLRVVVRLTLLRLLSLLNRVEREGGRERGREGGGRERERGGEREREREREKERERERETERERQTDREREIETD